MKKKRGFVVFDEDNCTFEIDTNITQSLIVCTLILDEILKTRKFASGVLLDIGCGLKPYHDVFVDNVSKYIGVDWASSCHQNRKIIDAFSNNNALPFKSNSFETVLCTEVLEHSPNPSLAIQEVWRVLKPGGTLIMTAPFMYLVHEPPWDYFRYTEYGLKHLTKEAGLEVIYIKPLGGYSTVVADFISKFMLYIFPKRIVIWYQKIFLFFLKAANNLVHKNAEMWLCEKMIFLNQTLKTRFAFGHILVAKKVNPSLSETGTALG
ncbi:MAG: class I SAM-dependent methyltransferase [Nitrospinota bacterium]